MHYGLSGKKVFLNNRTIEKINNPNLTILNRGSVTEQIDNPFCVWVSNGTGFYSTYFPPKKCGCDGLHDYGDLECSCPESPATLGSYQDVEYTFWVLDCSGGGSGNVDGANPADNPTGNTGDNNPPGEDPEDPTSQDEIITTPFVKGDGLQISNPDCEELKKNAKDSIFTQNMQFLKNDLLTSDIEKGFQIYNGNYITPPFPENPVVGPIVSGTTQHTPEFPYHISNKAIVHNHLKDPIHNHIGTFSPNDIIQLFDFYTIHQQQNSPVTQSEMASYLVCSEGNYVLKISNPNKLFLFVNKYAFDEVFRNMINKFYTRNNMSHGKPKKDQNIGFLKFLKKFDFGVKLFEGDENFENWEELELNNSGNDITKKPC